MTGIERLEFLADVLADNEKYGAVAANLREIAAQITAELTDREGYESDVLAWVEESGGLDAVRERLMPEGMEWLLEVWPKWSNGEYCKFGDWWVSDNYGVPKPKRFRRLSIYTPEQLDEWGQGDGESYDYEWDFLRPADPKYRPDKVEPPAPKVLDADGVEIHRTDRVWLLDGSGPYTVDCNWGDGTCSIVELVEHVRVDQLTHRAPVLAADGRPLREGDKPYRVDNGKQVEVRRVDPDYGEECVFVGIDGTALGYWLRPGQLTHERPDSFSLIEQDAELTPYDYAMKYGKPDGVSNGKFQRVDLVRRCRALAERGE